MAIPTDTELLQPLLAQYRDAHAKQRVVEDYLESVKPALKVIISEIKGIQLAGQELLNDPEVLENHQIAKQIEVEIKNQIDDKKMEAAKLLSVSTQLPEAQEKEVIETEMIGNLFELSRRVDECIVRETSEDDSEENVIRLPLNVGIVLEVARIEFNSAEVGLFAQLLAALLRAETTLDLNDENVLSTIFENLNEKLALEIQGELVSQFEQLPQLQSVQDDQKERWLLAATVIAEETNMGLGFWFELQSDREKSELQLGDIQVLVQDLEDEDGEVSGEFQEKVNYLLTLYPTYGLVMQFLAFLISTEKLKV